MPNTNPVICRCGLSNPIAPNQMRIQGWFSCMGCGAKLVPGYVPPAPPARTGSVQRRSATPSGNVPIGLIITVVLLIFSGIAGLGKASNPTPTYQPPIVYRPLPEPPYSPPVPEIKVPPPIPMMTAVIMQPPPDIISTVVIEGPPTRAQKKSQPAPTKTAQATPASTPNKIIRQRVRGGVPLTVVAERDSRSHAVKLVNKDTNAEVVFFHVNAGTRFAVNIPPGRYIIREASGDRWVNETELFGPDTSYAALTQKSAEKDVFVFQYNRKYTLTLKALIDGNVESTSLSAKDF